ncbi:MULTISPECIES: OsmC family protein [Salimicrobium]|uniref:Peroxiredoxin, SACOL1771 subfamily n=2 Tax=Salimicrobium TaxID=351195 RepID=A0ABY1KUZ2_9BACI|nr:MULTISPECIES: OsmC family protein [Salimicrobium]SDX82208.1 peroxiredoxin, SACOL1771 subfamily [Salimicrobium album]SIS81191.1 peroxiredoxin, SACOL1771 subfamily [Salimicrobium salexigens]
MTKHHFHMKSTWPGGRGSVGTIEADKLKTEISIPEEMDGPGQGTNPDEMLLGAASTCYIITLAAMMERAELPVKEMDMDSEGVVSVTNGVITYEEIIHRPRVALEKGASESELEKLRKLAHKAESSCMISRAIAGNVKLTLEPDLTVSK